MKLVIVFFFFNDTATTEIYTLSLHDALPIYSEVPLPVSRRKRRRHSSFAPKRRPKCLAAWPTRGADRVGRRSEEHTSELQSRQYLVCRLLLEKKKKRIPCSSEFTTTNLAYAL